MAETWTISAFVRDITDRKRAEAELEKTGDLLRAVAEGTTDAVFVKDCAGRYLLFNPAAARFVGRPVEDVLGRDDTEVFDADSARRVMAGDRRIMDSGEAATVEERLTAAGVTRTYLATKAPYRDRLGNVVGLVGISRDITDRIEAEAALRAAEHRLQHVIASSPAVLYTLTVEGDSIRGISWISDNLRELMGFSPEQAKGAAWWFAQMHPDDLERVMASTQQHVFSTGRVANEYRFRHHDGGYRWLRSEMRLVRDSEGRALEIVGSWSDITERKRIEEALQQSEEHYRSVVEGSLQGIAIQQDGRFRFANRQCAQMFGYRDAEEFLQQPWSGLVAPEDLAGLRERAEACLRGEAVPPHPGWRGIRRDGQCIWMQSMANLISYDGRPAVLCMFIDVTEHKRLEDQFRQAQKMEAIGQLAGGVAHDFNNLLTVIIGYSELIKTTTVADHPNQPFIEEVRKAGEKAASLTRQLLAFSRKQLLVPVVLDLNAVVKDMQKMLTRLIGEDIELDFAPAPSLWNVKADPGQLEQVIMNLIVNSRDAMPRGGRLTIETANVEFDHDQVKTHPDIEPGPHVVLTVADTGCGMDETTMARIFEPFFTTKGPEKGTGLGLATVFGIVQQSRGSIDVQSTPGAGTTFRIYLPRALDEPRMPKSRSTPGISQRGGETVLLAEDDDGIRSLTRMILEGSGYDVLEASNGVQALQICVQHKGTIHLLVSDVVMPNMSGPELARQAGPMRQTMKVLYLSGYTDDAVVRYGMIDADTPFLQKPFTPDGLLAKVRDVLDTTVQACEM